MEHVSSSGTSKPSAEELLAERGWLLGLARGLVGGSQAEDLVQDAYAVALERPPAGGYSGRAWLAGIARNLAAGRGAGAALESFELNVTQVGQDVWWRDLCAMKGSWAP